MAIQTPTENWFKFPNHIADNLTDYTTFEITILVLMLRRTVGMLGLTKTPDQRFSQSFIVKNTGISDSQVYRSKKSLIAKGAIKEDGTAADGSKLYSVVWDIPVDTPLCPPEVSPSSHQSNPPLSGRATDKDISLKKGEEKTLDASASSAALGFMHPINPLGDGGNAKCNNCGYIEPIKHGTSWCYPPKCPKCNVTPEITRLPEKAQMNHDVKLSGSKEAIEQLKAALPKQEKIPYKEISDYFLKKHREFRKVKDDKYMPKWGAKETLAVKRLWTILEERTTFSKPTTTLEKQIVIQKFMNLMVDRFISYLKKGKGQYAETTPILPSQLTTAVLDRLFVMSDIMDSAPKLEIKQYENKGIAIGPMPEGW
ncbi:hypothetical protein LPTSP1_36690 [Leptospira johnsonii]|uniref:Bacteriophage lambda Replication protein O N-terminal domain-containing protein n=2 Tax=Leptospira johnsonii TaxID=1917820 RepID=A0A2P2D7U3_9LEPT|nr:hypothetical protein LPTSP1_36690 [Leptospira johnsonii]